MPFWQFFRQGLDGRALFVRPSRIPHRISKIIFALGANELLAFLECNLKLEFVILNNATLENISTKSSTVPLGK